MVQGRARIESLEAGRSVLAEAGAPAAATLVVPVTAAVPEWLTALVVAAADAGTTVVIEAVPPSDLEGEALDGWEIGVCTAALAAGAGDVLGVDPRRVARVRAIDAALAAVPSRPTPEPAS